MLLTSSAGRLRPKLRWASPLNGMRYGFHVVDSCVRPTVNMSKQASSIVLVGPSTQKPPSGCEYLSLTETRKLSVDVSPMRAQNVIPCRPVASNGSRLSAPPSTEPQPIDTVSTAHCVKPWPVTRAAYMLPQRPPGIASASTVPSGRMKAPTDSASPPAHHAPLRPPCMAAAASGASMSSISAVGSIGSEMALQLMVVPPPMPAAPPPVPAAPPPPLPPHPAVTAMMETRVRANVEV